MLEQFVTQPPLRQPLWELAVDDADEPVEYVGLTLCMMGLVSSKDVSRRAEAEPDDVLLAAEDIG